MIKHVEPDGKCNIFDAANNFKMKNADVPIVEKKIGRQISQKDKLSHLKA